MKTFFDFFNWKNIAIIQLTYSAANNEVTEFMFETLLKDGTFV